MLNTPAIASSTTGLQDVESAHSAVSWGAVIAGATIAAAVSAMLVTGGTGLGFLSVSLSREEGVSGSSLLAGSVIWLLFTQIVAYGVAGYITGRLRTKWTEVASDEVHFRDTAHGFLVWALSTLIGLVLLGSTLASVVSGTEKAGATLLGAGAGAGAAIAGHAAQGDSGNFSPDYFTDVLLRPNDPASASTEAESREEVSRLLMRSVVNGGLSDADQSYLVQVISRRAGVDEATARQRLAQTGQQIRQTIQQAKLKALEAAEAARRAMIRVSLWVFVSLLLGAFAASFAATVGGRMRER